MIVDMTKMYPDTQVYDMNTLKPLNEVTKKRLEYLDKKVPELGNGGESLIDVGGSRGLVSLTYANKFKSIKIFEPDINSCNIGTESIKLNNINNITYYNDRFRDINCFQKGNPITADIVFVGNCHHYFFETEIKYKTIPFMFMKKLACMSNKYLIIDGPFEMNDSAVSILSKKYSWSEEVKKLYTFENFKKSIEPYFVLDRIHLNQAGVRHTAIFKRVKENIEHISYDSIKNDLKRGISLKCNPNRKPESVVRVGTVRYKFDSNSIPDTTFFILNSIPYFPKVQYIITDTLNNRIGDISEFIDGEEPKTHIQICYDWFKLNNELSSVGLFENQLSLEDYRIQNKNLIDVDVDMVYHWKDIRIDNYLKIWKDNVIKTSMDKRVIDYIYENVHKEDCFFKLMNTNLVRLIEGLEE